MFGVSRPLTFEVYIREFCLAVSAGCFSLVAGMAPAEQNGGVFVGNCTFIFIDNSENILNDTSNVTGSVLAIHTDK